MVAGDPQLEALVDAIDLRERGHALQERLGISDDHFATLRRRLKRKVAASLQRMGSLPKPQSKCLAAANLAVVRRQTGDLPKS